MTEQNVRWLERTIEAQKIPTELLERFGGDYIEQVCSGELYEQAQAVMALALDTAIEGTDINTRKKKRIGPQMIDWVLNGAAVVFMLGYLQAKEGKSGGNDGEKGD
jgi:hypothetical protein